MKSKLPDIALILATLVFGATFLATRMALSDIGPFELIAIRFSLGSCVAAIVASKRIKRITRQEVIAGMLIGVAIFLGFTFQTTGLKYLESNKSAFITSLFVPLVPLIQVAIFKKRPSIAAWAGTLLSMIGLALISTKHGLDFSFGVGEWLTLLCAVAFSGQIVLISRFAPEVDSVRLCLVQLVVVSILALVAIPVSGETMPHWTPGLIGILSMLGIVATGIAILAMNWAQKTVSATRATLIYAMEPVWAGILGAIVGERFTPLALAGCILILAGMLAGELGPRGEGEPEELAELPEFEPDQELTVDEELLAPSS